MKNNTRLQGGHSLKRIGPRSPSNLLALTSYPLQSSVGAIATFSEADDQDLSHIKIQKILYYMQGFCIAYAGVPLFPEHIEAWKFGPVVREVWYAFRDFGASALPTRELKGLYRMGTFNDDQLSIIRWVYSIRGGLSGAELVRRTHSETPWKRAYKDGSGGIITQSSMARFFRRVQG